VPQSLLARADEVIANVDLFRQVAPYVARILNGERCAQSGLSSRQTASATAGLQDMLGERSRSRWAASRSWIQQRWKQEDESALNAGWRRSSPPM